MNVTVYVDGIEAKPGQVVYCDRTQTVNLTFDSETVEFTDLDVITLEIFQKTKNANHFNFYYENPGSEVHLVEVFVSSSEIQPWESSRNIAQAYGGAARKQFRVLSG